MTRDPRATVKLTYDDYCRIPPDGLQHQLLDGEHVVTPAPRLSHQLLVTQLAHLLKRHVDEAGLGCTLVAPCDVLLGPSDVVQPDALVVVPGHRDRLHEHAVVGAPDLVVEVLSPSTRALDLGRKLERYAWAGVPEVWTVDADDKALVQRALTDVDFEIRCEHRERFRIAILPEVEIDLAELWRVLDVTS